MPAREAAPASQGVKACAERREGRALGEGASSSAARAECERGFAMAFGKQEVLAYLDGRGVQYQVVEHEAVFTMEAMEALGLPFADEIVKNLFLRDDKKRSYYLVVMPEDKPANLKELRRSIESRPLRFASDEDLAAYLGLFGGAVSPFGILNDEASAVEVIFDEELKGYQGLGIHPNDNTATVHIGLNDVIAMLEDHGNAYRFVAMSRPEDAPAE